MIQAALRDVLVANSTLEGINRKPKGTETLVPIGADSYMRAEISDSEKVVMGIGAEVCMEKTIDESLAELRNRQAELEKTRTSIEQQLGQILGRLENDRGRLNDLLRKKSGENVEVV